MMNAEQYAQKKRQVFSDEVPELLRKYLGTVRGGTLLDVGCGDGTLLRALDIFGFLKGRDVLAIDSSETRIKNARDKNPSIRYSVDSACELISVKNCSIDFLMSTQVIEHVPDDEAMVQQIRRVMKPGGVVYLSTVFKKPWAWYFYRCRGKWVLDPTHVREYQKETDLLELLKKHRLQVIEGSKSLVCYSLVDPLLKILRTREDFLRGKAVKIARYVKRPVPGYFCWEIVCRA